jgi:hypothetical protein
MNENSISPHEADLRPNPVPERLTLTQQREMLEQALIDCEVKILELAEQRVRAMQRFVYLGLEFKVSKSES